MQTQQWVVAVVCDGLMRLMYAHDHVGGGEVASATVLAGARAGSNSNARLYINQANENPAAPSPTAAPKQAGAYGRTCILPGGGLLGLGDAMGPSLA